jgi:hypothetical protein
MNASPSFDIVLTVEALHQGIARRPIAFSPRTSSPNARFSARAVNGVRSPIVSHTGLCIPAAFRPLPLGSPDPFPALPRPKNARQRTNRPVKHGPTRANSFLTSEAP